MTFASDAQRKWWFANYSSFRGPQFPTSNEVTTFINDRRERLKQDRESTTMVLESWRNCFHEKPYDTYVKRLRELRETERGFESELRELNSIFPVPDLPKTITENDLTERELLLAQSFGQTPAEFAADKQTELDYLSMWEEQERNYANELDSLSPPVYEESREG